MTLREDQSRLAVPLEVKLESVEPTWIILLRSRNQKQPAPALISFSGRLSLMARNS
jgi:hypothetical protein